MTIPSKMNCPHQGSGWCLDCVGRLAHALEDIRFMADYSADACPDLVGNPRRWEHLVLRMGDRAREALGSHHA